MASKNDAQRITMKPAFLDAYKDFMEYVNKYNAGAEKGVPHIYIEADYDAREGALRDSGPFLALVFAESKNDKSPRNIVLMNAPMLGRTPTSLRFVNNNSNNAYPVKGITTLYENGAPLNPTLDMRMVVDTSTAINQMSYTPLFDAEQDLCGEKQLNILARQDIDVPGDHTIMDYTRRIAESGSLDDDLEIIRELYDGNLKFENVAEESFKPMLRFAAYSKALDRIYEDGYDDISGEDAKLLNEACGVDSDEESLVPSAKKILGLDELERNIKGLSEDFADGRPFDISKLSKSSTLGLCSLGVYKSILDCTGNIENPMLSQTQYANLGCAVSMNNKEIDVAREKRSICSFIGDEVRDEKGNITKVWPADKTCYPKYTCSSAETGRKFDGIDFNGMSKSAIEAALSGEAADIRVDDDELYRICAASRSIQRNGGWKFSVQQNPYEPLGILEGVLRFTPGKGESATLDSALQPNNIKLDCFEIITKDGRELPLCKGKSLCVDNFEGLPMMERLGDNDSDILGKAIKDAFVAASKYTGDPFGHSMEIDVAGLDFQVFKRMYKPSDKRNMKTATMGDGDSNWTSIGVAKLKRSSYKQAPLAVMHIAGMPDGNIGNMAFGWLAEKAVAESAIEAGKIEACDIYDVDNKIRKCENLIICASEMAHNEESKNCDAYKAYAAFNAGLNQYLKECDACERNLNGDLREARMLFKKSDAMDQDTRMGKVAELLAKIPGTYEYPIKNSDTDEVVGKKTFTVDANSTCEYDADKKSFVIDRGRETECIVRRNCVRDAMKDAYMDASREYYESKAKLNDFLIMMDTYRPSTEASIKELVMDIDSKYGGDKEREADVDHLYRPQSGFEVAVIKHLVTEQGIDPDEYFRTGVGYSYNNAVSRAITEKGATQGLVEDAKRAVMSRATAISDCDVGFVVQICKDIDAYYDKPQKAKQGDSYIMSATDQVFEQAKQQQSDGDDKDRADGVGVTTPGE